MTESTLPTSQPRGSSRRQARFTLGACCSVHGLQDGLTATVFVLLPLLGQHFGLSYASVGIIRATHTCALSLFEYPSAILGDRQGAPRLLVFGLTCAGTGYVALSQAGGFITVLCALFLTGIGNAFQHSLASSLLSDTFEDGSRRVALGTYTSAGDVGKLVATGTMSLLLGMGVG